MLIFGEKQGQARQTVKLQDMQCNIYYFTIFLVYRHVLLLNSAGPCTVGQKSHDLFFHVFLMETGVTTCVTHCTYF